MYCTNNSIPQRHAAGFCSVGLIDFIAQITELLYIVQLVFFLRILSKHSIICSQLDAGAHLAELIRVLSAAGLLGDLRPVEIGRAGHLAIHFANQVAFIVHFLTSSIQRSSHRLSGTHPGLQNGCCRPERRLR